MVWVLPAILLIKFLFGFDSLQGVEVFGFVGCWLGVGGVFVVLSFGLHYYYIGLWWFVVFLFCCVWCLFYGLLFGGLVFLCLWVYCLDGVRVCLFFVLWFIIWVVCGVWWCLVGCLLCLVYGLFFVVCLMVFYVYGLGVYWFNKKRV